jgi:hypothetical protein
MTGQSDRPPRHRFETRFESWLDFDPSCTPRGVPLRIPIFKQPKTVTSYDGRLLLSRPDPQEAERTDRLPA